MAKNKVEADAEQSSNDDTWLHDWVNQKQEIKEEDKKPSLQKINYDCKYEDVNQQKFENNKKKLASSAKPKRKLSKRKDDQIINAKSKRFRKGNFSQGAIESNAFALNKEALENAPVSDIMKNLCECKCPQCEKKYMTKHSIRRHFKNTNHGSGSARGNVMKYLNKIVAHKCYVCSKMMLCEGSIVQNHISFLPWNCLHQKLL